MKLPNLDGCDGLGFANPRCWILPIIYLIITFIIIKRVTKLNNILSGLILFVLIKLALSYKNRPKPVLPENQ